MLVGRTPWVRGRILAPWHVAIQEICFLLKGWFEYAASSLLCVHLLLVYGLLNFVGIDWANQS